MPKPQDIIDSIGKRERRFKWVGRNKKFNEIWISPPLTTSMIEKGEFPSFFSISNRGESGNCEFIAEIDFTGLHDKNGKEIYEGDIVKFQHQKYDKEPRFAVIGFDDRWCSYTVTDKHIYSLDTAIDTLEVIGNIFENPDLFPTN